MKENTAKIRFAVVRHWHGYSGIGINLVPGWYGGFGKSVAGTVIRSVVGELGGRLEPARLVRGKGSSRFSFAEPNRNNTVIIGLVVVAKQICDFCGLYM